MVGDRDRCLDRRLRRSKPNSRKSCTKCRTSSTPTSQRARTRSRTSSSKSVGEKRAFDFQPRPHWELGEIVGGLESERGAKMSGSRFYVLKGPLARLQRALIQFFLNEHTAAGFTECYLPDMLSEASLYASGQLPKFRDNLYRDAEQDYYFIPTAEVAFVNLYRDEIIPAGSLPMRFRGAHALFPPRKDERRPRRPRHKARPPVREGRDVRLREPEDSEAELARLVARTRSLPEKLGIPYRVLRALQRRHRLQRHEDVRHRDVGARARTSGSR